ncbi:MAG: arylsulfotransferase family protein [Solirubrobacteraceae bacterium]
MQASIRPARHPWRKGATAILTLALIAAGAVALWPGGASRAATPTVYVFPIPGGKVAAPQTQITLRGIPTSQFGTITVTGSASGAHTGHVEADSDGDGGSFLPDKPFDPGERVTVHTGLNIAGAGGGTYNFTVANPAGAIKIGPGFAAPPRVKGDVWKFASAPQLFPAAVHVTKLPRGAESGDLFVAPQQGPVRVGPELLGPYGGLIWFKTVPKGQAATDFKAQHYRGKPVLTWWQGTVNGGVGAGQDEIYSSSYRRIATVKAGNGLRSDLHEFKITGNNTALVTAYYPVYWDTTGIKNGGPHDLVLDAVAQEIDIPTGLVLFQWDSLDHVPVADSYQFAPPNNGHPWDYLHINAISEPADGSILISGRNTWAAYDVSHQTAATNWILGGKSSTFTMGHDTQFMFQHDVRLYPNDEVSIFDDGAGPPIVHKRSRGLVLALDMVHKTATLVLQDEHKPGLLAEYEGSVQPQPNGDNLVGWGEQPYVTEFNSHGRPVFDARFVGANSSYRAFRFQWTGTPATRPSAAELVSGNGATAYASWNGANTVASWQILAGSSPSSLKVVASSRRKAFETAVRMPSGEPYVATRALDAHGHVLGTSKAVKAKTG